MATSLLSEVPPNAAMAATSMMWMASRAAVRKTVLLTLDAAPAWLVLVLPITTITRGG